MDDDKSVKIIRAETSAKTLTEKMNPSMKEEKGALRQSRCTEEKRQMNGLRYKYIYLCWGYLINPPLIK